MARVGLIHSPPCRWEAEGRVRGDLDVPLSSEGREETLRLARELGAEGKASFAVLFSSDRAPSCEAASIFARIFGAEHVRSELLRDVDLGLWQGLSYDELRERHPRAYREWARSARSVTPPGGEPYEEIVERACAALADVGRRLRRGGEAVVIVGRLLHPIVEALLRGEETPERFSLIGGSVRDERSGAVAWFDLRAPWDEG